MRLWDRRKFIQTTTVAGLSFLLSEQLWSRSNSDRASKVIVVGAGFAGLAAAHELMHTGFKTIVVDRASRVGGRVSTLRNFLPGDTIEAGGELIGTNHPLWLAYAKRFNLPLLEMEELDGYDLPIVINGQRVSKNQEEKLWQEIKQVTDRLNEGTRPIDSERPWLSASANQLDRISLDHWLHQQAHVSEMARRAVRSQLEGDNAAPLKSMSYLGMLSQVKGGGIEKYWTESERLRCGQGNDALATALARTLPDIRLGKTTTRIKILPGHCEVRLADGTLLEGEFVVLTIPPTQWGNVQLEPAPNFYRTRMLGDVVKSCTRVRRRFWLAAKTAPTCLFDRLLTWSWEGAKKSVGSGPSVLITFSGGPAATQLKNLDAPIREKEIIRELSIAYPGIVDERQKSVIFDWSRVPGIQGGYSFPRPGDIIHLGPELDRLFEDRLFFAGEHTYYAFPAYMENALQSGVRAAKVIAGIQSGTLKTHKIRGS